MKPNHIILLRQGESEGKPDKNKYLTIPDYALHLTPTGIDQAQAAGGEIKQIIGAESLYVYLSPYLRARETFQQLRPDIEGNIIRIIEDPRIRQMDWGHFRHPDENEEINKRGDEYSTFIIAFPTENRARMCMIGSVLFWRQCIGISENRIIHKTH